MLDEIILRSVYGKVGQKYFLQPCADPKTQRFPECVKTIDQNGDMILSESDKERVSSGEIHFVKMNHIFVIEDGHKFNLGDVVEAAHWDAIKHTDLIAENRFAKDREGNPIIDGGIHSYGRAELYVERPGEITKARVTKKQLVFNAQRYIYEDSESERIKKCKVLGRDLSNATPADILDYMLSISEKTPQRITDLYEDEGWKMQLFLIDAVDRGVISKRNGIYEHQDRVLGSSMEGTIAFLQDVRYRTYLNTIKKETYPEYLSKEELDKLKAEATHNIPQYEELMDAPKPKAGTTSKPKK